MKQLRCYLFVLSTEIKKLVSYRADFWVHLSVPLISMFVAIFLWGAIFESSEAQTIGGYSFHTIIIYYVISPYIRKAGEGLEFGQISNEIYMGTLNRYLLYPINFFLVTFQIRLAQALYFICQLFLALTIYGLFWEYPESMFKTENQMPFLLNLFLGITLTILAITINFLIYACLELVAFWSDKIWSLIVMMRFITHICGGVLLPLSIYPNWAQEFLTYLPFKYMVSMPTKMIMGQVTLQSWMGGCFMLFLWGSFFYFILQLIWRRGTLRYSGVGI